MVDMAKAISGTIVKYGTDAVVRYRAISGILYDNEVPEVFLGGFVACGIYDDLKRRTRVERLYTAMVSERNKQVDPSLDSLIGGQRAGVAIYGEIGPEAAIELKKFADYDTPLKIVADADKLRQLSKLCGIEGYVGVLVTDVTSGIGRRVSTFSGHRRLRLETRQMGG